MCHGVLEERMKLADVPLANSLTNCPNEGKLFPLTIMECVDCGHVQSLEVITEIEGAYPFRTPQASVPNLVQVAKILHHRHLNVKTIVEIGSNNGLNTDILHGEFGGNIINVDPNGTHWAAWKEPMSLETAKRIYKRIGPIDLVVANNVLAHIDDLDDVMEGIEFLLSDEGAVIIEVQDFSASVRHGWYDMLYHEHMDQHTVYPWAIMAKRFGMAIFCIDRLDVHGGSFRLELRKVKGPNRPLAPEDRNIDWDEYRIRTAENMTSLDMRTPECVAWGASAKLTMLIHQSNLQDRIKYVVDSTPEKQGKYLPCTSIPIVADFKEGEDRPVLLGAWNYAEVFEQQYPHMEAILPYG
ncbi:class I SAM-dependent methyltransferase [Porticoccaceae bacterium]|nr:class I SAM-dependent methyltransferase [Porticoccaceae bacterium]